MSKINRKLQEQVEPAIIQAVNYVLANAPRGMAQRSRYNLQSRLDGGNTTDWFSAEFQRVGGGSCTEATLYFNFKTENYEVVEDADGNLFRSVRFNVEVSWASFGSQTAAQALVRAQLMRELSEFAVELECLFPDSLYQLRMTAAERAEADAKLKRERVLAYMRGVILERMKGARVDDVRSVDTVPDSELAKCLREGFADGAAIEIDVNGKNYRVAYAGGEAVGRCLFEIRRAA